MAAEGAVILVLLLVLLIVVGWACKVKSGKTKSVTLTTNVDEDNYTITPGTAAG